MRVGQARKEGRMKITKLLGTNKCKPLPKMQPNMKEHQLKPENIKITN